MIHKAKPDVFWNPLWMPGDVGSFLKVDSEALQTPRHWNIPLCVEVADVFHPFVPDDAVDQVFAMMGLSQHHTFQVCTLYPERMATYLADGGPVSSIGDAAKEILGEPVRVDEHTLPLPNVALGFQIEYQENVDTGLPWLIKTPAAVRLVRCSPREPLSFRWRGGVNYNGQPQQGLPANEYDGLRILHWVIVEGSFGQDAIPMHPDWVRMLRDQCASAGVPFCFSSWGDFMPTVVTFAEFRRGALEQKGERIVGPAGQFVSVPWKPTFQVMRRVGRDKSGCILDGAVWDQSPVSAPIH